MTNRLCVPDVAVDCAVAVTMEEFEEETVFAASGERVPTDPKLLACD